jgi:GTP cyclohydrolase I
MARTNDEKSDFELGLKVRQMLLDKGIETPSSPAPYSDITSVTLERDTRNMLFALGLDLNDDSLRDTPKRVAKMWLNELFWGLNPNNFPKSTVVDNKMNYDEMVLERRITVQSMCEHHLLPILGHAHVAYIPRKKVLGLSKMNRIVEYFSRRPQIQERLTAQICETLQFLLETEDVAVCIDAEHLCVKMRGVEDSCSDTVTSKLGGVFKSNSSVRNEFFSLINTNR